MFERWHQASLRRTLVTVLLPAMLLAAAGELWLTWRTALDAANAAYDRSLLGAIKAVDANISTESGGLGVELPYRMLEFFELTANGQVFFRVSTEDGLVEIGNSDLPPPPPPRELPTGRAVFSDATYLDQPLRLGAYARELDPPLSGPERSQRVVIQVGETTGSRREFTQALVLQSVARNLLLLALGAALVVGIIAWALRPLERLRSEVASRSTEDMRPVRSTAIPAEVQPLVEAINQHIERHREASEARRAFIDDASHQLRTPLTTLTTQLGYALRESDPALQREALQALRSQLDETVRQTNQMLTLARADSAELPSEWVDATALAETVTRAAWPLARELGQDLGFEPASGPAWVLAPAALLREALSNLVHNATRYTPRGGRVTVRVAVQGSDVRLAVLDNGPGIPAAELARAGERFFRGSRAGPPGSGLGLAIVRSIAQRHGGRLQLDSPGECGGLTATLVLPAAPRTRSEPPSVLAPANGLPR
jgi:two-component system sensor histidine kinase TctE